ncbi:hypothetical protein ACU4GD_11450 [Cupriavidus basilensis]
MAGDDVRAYLNALMMDLALADPDQQEAALLRAGRVAQALGSLDALHGNLRRDAGFGKREMDRYNRQLAKEARGMNDSTIANSAPRTLRALDRGAGGRGIAHRRRTGADAAAVPAGRRVARAGQGRLARRRQHPGGRGWRARPAPAGRRAAGHGYRRRAPGAAASGFGPEHRRHAAARPHRRRPPRGSRPDGATGSRSADRAPGVPARPGQLGVAGRPPRRDQRHLPARHGAGQPGLRRRTSPTRTICASSLPAAATCSCCTSGCTPSWRR